MGWWTDRALPRVVDRVCGVEDIHELRAVVCAPLHGRVLEVGFGSGHSVRHYPEAVESVDAVEPSDVAWRLAQTRIEAAGTAVRREGLDGQHLTAADHEYDCALSTFTLCTIPELDVALDEIKRVLQPEGTLHFLEHGLSPDAGVARWQQRIGPVHGRVFGGCHLDRPIVGLIERAGFEIVEVEEFCGAGAKVASYLSTGFARRTA